MVSGRVSLAECASWQQSWKNRNVLFATTRLFAETRLGHAAKHACLSVYPVLGPRGSAYVYTAKD